MPTLGVFAVIFDEAGRLLCVRLNYASKRWTTPGGRVETGESPLEALKREVLEETGLSITPGELLGVYAKPEEDDLVLSFRATVVGETAWQANGAFAVVDVDTLWKRNDGVPNHWLGRACKFYTLTARGWKMIAQTGLLDYSLVAKAGT